MEVYTQPFNSQNLTPCLINTFSKLCLISKRSVHPKDIKRNVLGMQSRRLFSLLLKRFKRYMPLKLLPLPKYNEYK